MPQSFRRLALLTLLAVTARASAPAPIHVEAALRANNRGVAEMGRSSFPRAESEFRAALAADPDLIEARINLGIAQHAAGDDTAAKQTLLEVIRRDPQSVHAHYVLGLIAKDNGAYAEALRQFHLVLAADPHDKDANYFTAFALAHMNRTREAIRYFDRALDANPNDLSSLFGISNAYRSLGQTAKAMVYLRRFLALRRASKLNTTVTLVYGGEGKYALAEDLAPAPLRTRPHPVPVHFEVATAAAGIHFRASAPNPATFPGSGACVIDAGDNGRPGLLLLNGGGAPALYRNDGGGHFTDITQASGVAKAVDALGCAVGDYNNDGHPDIAITAANRLWLFKGLGGGKFQDVTAAAGLTGIRGNLGVAWIDLAHNGFLDLVITSPGPQGKVKVYRNLGTGKFVNVSARSAIGQTPASYQGLVATDYDNNRDIDVVLARGNGPLGIFDNRRRNGTFFEVHPWPGDPAAGGRAVVAFDYDHTGWMDLFVTRMDGPPVLLHGVGGGRYRVASLPPVNAQIVSGWGATAIDFDNDGFVDLAFIAKLKSGREQLMIYRNRGDGTFEDVSRATGADRIALHHARAIVTAEFEGSGAPDLLITQADGSPILLRNVGGSANHSLLVQLIGRKDNNSAIGAKVTLRAAGLWQKTEIEGGSGYLGENDLRPLFGLGSLTHADSVRMVWPTGVVQEEFPAKAPTAVFHELNRAGGSCPILYSWDGRRFRFIDDLIGPGVIGEWTGPHQYDTPQPAECLKLPRGAVAERHGQYQFRFTDQMEEVVYLDEAHLTVVDHPAGEHVFSNDRWQPAGPPPREHFWTVGALRPVTGAVDGKGHNLLPDLLQGHYTPIHARSPFRGWAGLHTLTLNLGDLRGAHRLLLLLHGWTDYYFPDTEWTAYHAGIADHPPALQLPDGHGGWKTYLASMGAPAGLPRWLVVNLTPALRAGALGTDARVRIVTNDAIYWNRALVAINPLRQPELRLTRLRPTAAQLRFLGYPRQLQHKPAVYDYASIQRNVGFRRVTGNYTRYGNVLPLLRRRDDQDVIMASGDEIAFSFSAQALPPLPRGWVRTFFFCADGFTKGDEYLSSHPYRVAPMPYHGVAYPTPARHRETVPELRTRVNYDTRHIEMGGAR